MKIKGLNNAYDVLQRFQKYAIKSIIKDFLESSEKDEDKNLADMFRFWDFAESSYKSILFDLWLRKEFQKFFFENVSEEDMLENIA